MSTAFSGETRKMQCPHVIHISPHPDDEAVGAPATLLAFRDRGIPVANIVTSLGAPADRDRRRAEVLEAGRIGGLRVEILEEVIAGDPAGYEEAVTAAILAATSNVSAPVILVSPSPHDKHPRHEAVGRATAAAAVKLGDTAVWWMYSVWGALPLPTAYLPFGGELMGRADRLLSAYVGEIDRNDYRRLVRGRSMAASVLGAEQIFGFGSTNDFAEPYAELFTEVGYRNGKWLAGIPRCINPSAPITEMSDRDITSWVTGRSPSDLVAW
ncbi:PIG-L deacetylase family protein [Rhodococcus qingshengii]|uniref:PIG-L deacetylase family protein n=1 Tax=Rhodococcus qingshengii TaxID=334542 RepID=UPI001C5FE4CF|nr:PIG-L family deacetylase [Rhodococcus qingshengii]